MSGIERPLLILSDIHLGPATRTDVLGDVERVIRANAGCELVLAGDIFDLSLDPKRRVVETLAHLLDTFDAFKRALQSHVACGGRLTFLPGNHDEGTVEPEARNLLLEKLGISGAAPLTIAPWFVRRNGIHVEHGHLFDPDNAPVHPLSPSSFETEPLGVALTRRFIAETGALHFAHAHDATPARALLRAFRLYGATAPSHIARYFRTAGALWLQAAAPRNREAVAKQRENGAARLPQFAHETGLDAHQLDGILGDLPLPTHLSSRQLFMRLYFDRVFATLALGGGIVSLFTGRRTGLAFAAAGAGYLFASLAKQQNRYGTLPEQRLRDGAALIREATGASTVIFGHTHREDEAPGYFNAGSFAFSKNAGRSFIHVSESCAVTRRRTVDLA